MQHVHYDLAQIEAGTRRMYAEAPAGAISDEPKIEEIFKRSIEVEISMQRFVMNEIMRGEDPGMICAAFQTVMVNLIMNSATHFIPAGGCIYCQLVTGIAEGIRNAHSDGEPISSGSGVPVIPVVSGQA